MNIVHVLIVLVIVVGSVILHELSHGLVAYWLGDSTAKDAGRLTFNPIKHIDPYMSILVPVILYLLNAPVFGGAKPIPIDRNNLKWREWGTAIVALAGPFTNFLLALIAFLIGFHTKIFLGAAGVTVEFIISSIVSINLGFMIFNLIPIPPLDGSRVLYALAPDGVRAFLATIEQYGFIIVYALIFLLGPIFSNLMLNAMQAVLSFFYFLVGVPMV